MEVAQSLLRLSNSGTRSGDSTRYGWEHLLFFFFLSYFFSVQKENTKGQEWQQKYSFRIGTKAGLEGRGSEGASTLRRWQG